MGCKDAMFRLRRSTSWAESVNCIWNGTNPSCLSFLPADGCTVISFLLLAAKAASPWVLEYVKKFTPEGRCFLNNKIFGSCSACEERGGKKKRGSNPQSLNNFSLHLLGNSSWLFTCRVLGTNLIARILSLTWTALLFCSVLSFMCIFFLAFALTSVVVQIFFTQIKAYFSHFDWGTGG